MKVIIRIPAEDEARALGVLFRHSQGAILSGRTYVLSEEAVRALRREGIAVEELSREAPAVAPEGAGVGERI